MRKLLLFAFLLTAIMSCSSALAQTCSQSGNSRLYCVPILSVEKLSIPGSTVVPTVPPAFSALNSSLGIQLSDVPKPSPASGIVFSFGPSGLTRERELGPIFTERPSIVGRHKLYVAFTYQYFEFDKIDSVSLKNIPLLLSGCQTGTTGCTNNPFIATESRLDLKVHQFTLYATYGILSRLDVSVAVPLLDVRMGMTTACSICGQTQPDGNLLLFTPNVTAANAGGIGDVTFRVKGTVLKGEKAGLAVGVDLRAPTGNDLNYLGSGAIGVRPFAAVDYRGRISPHASIGYQANGSSILASTDQSTSKSLPNFLTYTVGADFGVLKSLSVTADLLGATYFNASRLLLGTVTGPQGLGNHDVTCSLTSNSTCQGQTFNTDSFSVGAKYNPRGNLLVTANVLFKLDNNGLHYKPAPMAGISYTF
ncbi:MAG: hypothetical protein ABSE86_35250 [Bryobacteraceae bacterium]|jgi:hypothetical protein